MLNIRFQKCINLITESWYSLTNISPISFTAQPLETTVLLFGSMT